MNIELPTAENPVVVVCGDALDVLRALADGCVDAVVTDPPYGTGGYRRTAPGQGFAFASGSRREEWDAWDTAWLLHAFRVSRGPVLTFCPDVELPSLISNARSLGYCSRLLHWCKPDPMPHQGGQPAFGVETVAAFGSLQKCGGRSGMEAIAPRENRDAEFVGHPYQKPLKILRWLVQVACPPGGLVLDPFAGSGTTAVAALHEGRRCLVVEKDAGYCAIIRKRVAAALDEGLFAVGGTRGEQGSLFPDDEGGGAV